MDLLELYGLMDRFEASGLTALEWEKDGERVALRREGAAAQFRPLRFPCPPPPQNRSGRVRWSPPRWLGCSMPLQPRRSPLMSPGGPR